MPTPPSRVAVIIPARDEERSIPRVLRDIPEPFRDRVVVVDNGSTDGTAMAARAAGAQVVSEPTRGYGRACLRGLATLAADPPQVVVFLDADYSDDPRELVRVAGPVLDGRADLVIGSRVLGTPDPGALAPHQRFGNALATRLLRIRYGVHYTDLGPFRAVTWAALCRMAVRDPDYGWTVQMQLEAARLGLRVLEVPVSYRKRIGRSKISGTIRGSLGAGRKILGILLRDALRGREAPGRRGRGVEW